MKRLEVQAKSVEAARAELARRIGVPEARIHFEVLEAAKSGVLGLGGRPARVRGTLLEGRADVAKSFVKDFFRLVGSDSIVISRQEDEHIMVSAEGDFEWFTGQRGEPLESLQRLVNLVAQRSTDKGEIEGDEHIILDVGGFRERRKEQLEHMADEIARQILASGKPAVLEPMPPPDRRIVHMALKPYPTLTTRSEGEEPFRRVIVELVQGPDGSESDGGSATE